MSLFTHGRRRQAAALACFLVFSLFLTSPQKAVAAATYHVSVSGSDANSGTDALTPWRTLGRALGRQSPLKPGDTLLVHGGTYRERVGCFVTSGARICRAFKPDLYGQQGTSTAPIRVAAAPGERPVIFGLLWAKNARYWIFDGINVTWDSTLNKTDEPAVKFLGGRGWSFRNGEVKGAHSYANFFVGGGGSSTEPSNWSIRNSCIHHTFKAHTGFLDHNIYVSASVSGGLIERNIIFSAPAGDNIKVAAGGASSPQPKYVTIRYNTIYGGGQNIRVGHSSRNIKITRNILGRATGKDWYPNIRGFYSSGKYVVASYNLGYSAKKLIYNTNSSTGVKNGGGNVFPHNPLFDATACGRFIPRSTKAKAYGRWAGIK